MGSYLWAPHRQPCDGSVIRDLRLGRMDEIHVTPIVLSELPTDFWMSDEGCLVTFFFVTVSCSTRKTELHCQMFRFVWEDWFFSSEFSVLSSPPHFRARVRESPRAYLALISITVYRLQVRIWCGSSYRRI